ncbi:MAG: PEGA domain-containing protein [Ignavibacteriaceae bacterium]
MKNTFAIILTIAGLFSFNACSTVFNTTTQEVELKSNPPNANIIVDGKKFGTSPQTVNIDRGTNHIIKFELDGYENYETQVTRKVSNWFWVNALNGFLPGMVIDMFTGSMYHLLPQKLEVELSPAKEEIKTKKK